MSDKGRGLPSLRQDRANRPRVSRLVKVIVILVVLAVILYPVLMVQFGH